jgi:hypothetical protein
LNQIRHGGFFVSGCAVGVGGWHPGSPDLVAALMRATTAEVLQS